jgi:hypothetical protein
LPIIYADFRLDYKLATLALKNPSLSTDLCYTLVVSIFGLDDCISNDLIGCSPWKSGTNDEIELVGQKLPTSALKGR